MPRPKGSVTTPVLTRHKASGRAVVRIDGKDHYCGSWGRHGPSAAARKTYDRLIGEWLVRGRQTLASGEAGAGITVKEVLAAFWIYASDYYKSDDRRSGELNGFKIAMRPVKRLYGDTSAASFGPNALRLVRDEMLKLESRGRRWSRKHVNRQTTRIKSIFQWASSVELIPPTIYHGLLSVKGLAAGRCDAPDHPPVRPVDDSMVEAVRPLVSAQVRAMIDLQLLTGARPGEICAMRTGEIDRTREVWIYTPRMHKTAHHGHERTIRIGARAQDVLRPFLKLDPQAAIFSPQAAEADRRAEQREARQTPLTPSQLKREQRAKRRRRRRAPGECYTVSSYRRAIARACDEAFPPPGQLRQRDDETERQWMMRLTPEQRQKLTTWRREHRWHPHQLRHTAATRLRRDFGIDAARIILGHRSAAVTETYAELDASKADEIMGKVG